ncbi:curli production assembly/transport protein CsgF [Alcanivorax hongdengensis A-11-3]|uniref:Curli production assembly/transport component CsgF n=1 Tax=Alcanivorax hongdengensis A-11-3 TaxID=1177179 RepID=L0WF32_9GAMM|nr:curli assembly protein CsgF [Alcanivorax hongdengensis]EKF75646.1 curli production assembly/transport protein CsgF [Alcanivorax hongdengensis A-11-3]
MKQVIAFSLLALSLDATASELVYQPVNPNFGGNPLNGNYLLGNAQAQNDYKDPDATTYERPSDLERLASSLQSRLLSQLLSDVGDGQEGSIVTDDFSINIVNNDSGDGLSILIQDLASGEVTQIDVDGLVPDTF